MKRLTKEAAYRALENSGDRHARNIAAGQLGSKAKLFAPELLAIYAAESKRMRDFITEAETAERRLDRIVGAIHMMMRDKQFCVLLVSEGLETIPRLLAHRLQGATREPQVFCPPGKPLSDKVENRELVRGICPDVLGVLRDSPVKTKIFGLLQKVLPARQLEIARLMVALDRVRLTYARVLVALTPQALLVSPSVTRTQLAGIDANRFAAMETELAALSQQFLSNAEQLGSWRLELVAARGYLNRLLDNARLVRYLARNFAGALSEFQKMIEHGQPVS